MSGYDEEIREYMPTLEQLKDCFFDCSLSAYPGGGHYEPSEEIPGAKVFSILYGATLAYRDLYIANNHESGGITTISLVLPRQKPFPLWMMQYEGCEETGDKKVIMLLKEALKTAYEKKEFVGGRGPDFFPWNESCNKWGLAYRNMPKGLNEFDRFSGTEKIIDRKANIVFHHNYSGKLLVPIVG